MIVAMDATPLTVSSGGVKRYTEQLIQALRTHFSEDEYHLVSDQLQTVTGLDRRWWSIGVQRTMRRLRCSVFHGTDFSVPYLPLRPSVMTIHDLSPWMNPEWHHAADRVRKRTPFLVRLGIATMIITPTEAVRKQVIHRFGVSPSRVTAVHLGPVEGLRRVNGIAPERRYFVFVGTLEPRKNVPALVNAWRSIRPRCDVDLVIAGRRREDGPELPRFDGLHVVGEVPDSQLAVLYSGAIGCVYPTLYEGFGLPVLEAMQCGLPVITSCDPAVMEVSGGAAIHVQPNERDLAEAMEALFVSHEERTRRRQLSLRRAADFSWIETARQTRNVYYEAIERFHG